MASSDNQMVRSPRRRRPASYSGQLRTRYGDLAYLYWLRFGILHEWWLRIEGRLRMMHLTVDQEPCTKASSARDRTIRMVKDIGATRQWKKASGYHRQALVENAFFRYKSIIGTGLRARTPGGQRAEALLACNILNRMTDLGGPESYDIGR